MQLSDWPEFFGMARTKELAQRYWTTLLVEVVGWEREYEICSLGDKYDTHEQRLLLCGLCSYTRNTEHLPLTAHLENHINYQFVLQLTA